MVRENLSEIASHQVVPTTASGLQGEQPLANWNNVDKGSRQNSSVTSGKGMALRIGWLGPPLKPELSRESVPSRALAPRRRRWRGWLTCLHSRHNELSTQNWSGQGEPDSLIKTKHCDGV